jgi:hypothetical protein
MLKLADVLKIVQPHLDGVALANDGAEIVVTSAERHPGGWRVIYNTKEFAETGDTLYCLLGNLPIEVHDDGTIGPGETTQ